MSETTTSAVIEAIDDGPQGPETAAFFDLDGTLVRGYTAQSVYRDRLRRFDVGPEELARTTIAAVDMRLRGADLDGLMTAAVEALAGRTHEDLVEMGERLFRGDIASAIYPEAQELLAAHRRAGHRIVMATSATPYQSEPLGRELGFDAVLCTRPEVVDGKLTGRIDGGLLWGPGKAAAVRAFAEADGVRLERSYAYSNGEEDTPMLESVARPCALNPEDGLVREADREGWPVLRLAEPKRGFSVGAALRTGAALTGLAAGGVVGGAIGLLNRDRRTGGNVAGAIGPDLALALGGVKLRVKGEENLWARRPAVFMFNHQSGLDVPIIGSLIRRDVTGVAKKEAARDPRFAPIGAIADVAYIDRSNTKQAVEAMRPAVEKLKAGTSIAIAPEGTRSATPKLGRFKKGGFHIAIQAGVPVVPIVIRNAGDLMWRNSFFMHSGVVDVVVLEPIATEGWSAETIDEHVADVRARFEATLAGWPDMGPAQLTAGP